MLPSVDGRASQWVMVESQIFHRDGGLFEIDHANINRPGLPSPHVDHKSRLVLPVIDGDSIGDAADNAKLDVFEVRVLPSPAVPYFFDGGNLLIANIFNNSLSPWFFAWEKHI